ncbi:Nn.00g109470.m01.CDS01 [Neocucurbitaria sp. VM-36]
MVATIESDIDTNYEVKDLQHSLRNANLELSLERSKHSVEVVAKDEEIRKLRVSQCLLQDDNNDLHEQLEDEQARSDELENALDEALAQLDEQKAASEVAQNQIRTQAREIANLRAELKAMENVTSDSNKVLSDKLALSREMSSLRPEVEHLRAQVESNQGLLTEKLALQRQLTTLQVELENEKRNAARALAKQGRRIEQDEDIHNELEEVRRELAKEKKDRLKAEAGLAKSEKAVEKIQVDLESQQQATERLQSKIDKLSKKEADKASKHDEAHDAALEELRQELEREKSARKKAEKANKDSSGQDAEIEQLRQELEQEKRERQRAEKISKKGTQHVDSQADSIKKELEEEKRERKKQEKEYSKTLAELQGRNTVLDDKLTAFREKLRSTKEKLKEREAELERAERAHTAPPTKSSAAIGTKPAAKNARKRMATTAEPETNLGTPGDGVPTKKMKRGTSVSAVGDTSTFSLTPFLKRNASAAPASPIAEEEEEEGDEPIQEPTPTAQPKKTLKKAAQPKVKALAPAASNKANAKPHKKAAVPALEMVTEEASEISSNISKDNSENAPITIPLKDADEGLSTKSKPVVPKFKPRKSLMSFATFAEEPTAEKKKKRKLGASAGKTLFDAEDAEDAAPLKPVGISKGLFAARALGKNVLGKGALGQQRPISGGFGMLSEEAFTFSPLKKDRRGGASILK